MSLTTSSEETQQSQSQSLLSSSFQNLPHSPSPPFPPLASVIPPILLGTAAFNSQYNPDPYLLPTTKIVHRALDYGFRGFDTSPYYGPAETLLGAALSTDHVQRNFPRSDYFISTKVGRISADTFDYSPSWVRSSIERSLQRLRTEWLDLVFCHDVEFVDPPEVIQAVRSLRELRSKGKVRYIGISGYPTQLLSELAELVLKETGEPLDAVMSYANFTLQNTKLWTEAVPRLKESGGVNVVLNASPLGMGLLRKQGVPLGSMGDFHPSAPGLRKACYKAAEVCEARGEKLETVAIRFALENWTWMAGTIVGTKVWPVSQSLRKRKEEKGGCDVSSQNKRLGVSVCGVSFLEELEETIKIWESIFAAEVGDPEHLDARDRVEEVAQNVRQLLGDWVDNAWDSPSIGFVRRKPTQSEN